MAIPLTILNAEIRTAAVEIKTLTVSGKQVTLAVFRQLLDEQLVNDDGTLNGTPWGIVNYHPDKCADYVPHFHIVWQRGMELLRTAVSPPEILRGKLDSWQSSLLRDIRVKADGRQGYGEYITESEIAEKQAAITELSAYIKTVEALVCLPQLFIAV